MFTQAIVNATSNMPTLPLLINACLLHYSIVCANTVIIVLFFIIRGERESTFIRPMFPAHIHVLGEDYERTVVRVYNL